MYIYICKYRGVLTEGYLCLDLQNNNLKILYEHFDGFGYNKSFFDLLKNNPHLCQIQTTKRFNNYKEINEYVRSIN